MSQKAPKLKRSIAALGEFEAERVRIRAQGNIAVGLKGFRTDQHPAKIYRLAGRFSKHPAYRGLTLPAPFPRKISDLPKQGFHMIGSFLTEFAWVASLMKAHATELKGFVALRDEIETAFLAGETSRIESLLVRAEAAFGQSAWLIENRINLHDLTGGVTSRNRYLQSIWHPNGPPLFQYLISWYSYRSGSGVSAGEVERLLDDVFKKSSGYSELILAMNGRYPHVTQECAGEMMNYSDVFPLIDRYQVMLVALQCLFASSSLEDWALPHLQAILADLSKDISDIQLQRVARAFGVPVSLPLNVRVLDLQERFRLENYEDIVKAFDGDHQPALDIESLEILVRSKLILEQSDDSSFAGRDNPIIHEVSGDLTAVLSYSEDGVEARLRLQKLLLAFCNSSWAASLRLVLERQQHDERVLEPTPLQTMLGLRSAIEHPTLALTLPSLPRTFLTNQHQLGYPDHSVVRYINQLCDGELQVLPEDFGSPLDIATFLLRRLRMNDVLELLQSIAQDSPTLVELDALRLLATTYWMDSQVPQMADLTASLFVRSRYFGAILPIKELVAEFLKWHDQPIGTSPTRGKLSVAIIFDIFSRQVSSQYDAERADAFKDVLRANTVRKASELDGISDRFSVPDLIYFLRFVCVPDVLDQSLALDTSRAVEDERVAILLLISELSGGKVPAAIKDELREIRTKQVVRDTTLRLDQSKIYVNVEGIRRSIDVSMRDDWNRYRLMNDGIEQTLFDILEQVRGDKAESMKIIIAKPSERFSVLKRMINSLRDEFTMNKEFGLNSNLSTNIRHGYVEREIRGPLLARNLITNKDTDSGSYLQNRFWLERMDGGNGSQEKRLSAIFDKFSGRIDDQIDRINRQLLRVQSEKTPEGLFKYALSDSALMASDSTLASKETFDEFIDAVFAVFWDGTQRNLVQVRSALTTSVLTALIECLNTFAQDVASEGFDERLPDLEHAITMVQTEMRAAIDRVASWFTLSSNNEYQDFDLAIAFQAGMNTVKTYFRNISISETYQSESEIVMNGWCLPIFARLFFLILDNAATHGARNRPTLRISLVVEIREGHLFIQATNDLPQDHDNAELCRRAEEINRDYGQARAMELLSEEGGSGYPKIWKLLKTDLRKNHDLVVNVSETEFSVEILLPTGGIVNEASDR